MGILHNKLEYKEKRKNLRNTLTPAESTLWKLIQNNKLGKKFRRQHGIGVYIVDFYCTQEKLVIELDGHAHFTEGGMAYDQERTSYFNVLGIRVIRFENKHVFEVPEHVLEEIRRQFRT